MALFPKEYGWAGVEKVSILAYLFGSNQGYHEMYGENARKNLTSHLITVSYAGKAYGFMEALIKTANGKKVYFILDNLKVHHSRQVSQWAENHRRGRREIGLAE